MTNAAPLLHDDELVRVDALRLGDRILNRGQARVISGLAWERGPSFIRLTFAAGDAVTLPAAHRVSREKRGQS